MQVQTRIPASEQQAEDWLRHLKTKYLSCRAWGHNWPRIETPRHRRYFHLDYDVGAGEKTLWSTCMNCGRERYTVAALNSPIFPAKWHQYTGPKDYAAPYGAMKHLKGMVTFKNESMRRYEEEIGGYIEAEHILTGTPDDA